MEIKKKYGILFKPEKISDTVIMLKPDQIINGFYHKSHKDELIDKNNRIYKPVDFSKDLQKYEQMYGFGILEEELLSYIKTFDSYEQIIDKLKNDTDKIAKVYLKVIQQCIIFIEKEENDISCSAITIGNKNVYEDIDLNLDAFSQLSDLFGIYQILNSAKKTEENPLNPSVLYDKLTERVIGQDDAAFKLSATVCKNIKYSRFENMKSNILMYGPTGCGKTELARSLAKTLNLPIVIEDMTHYTASGYVGDSVKSILRRLYSASNFDMEKAQHGIIVLDEIDKLATTDSRETVNKTDVQQELLKMIEGGKFNLGDNDKASKEIIMDTSNIIFILSGAFSKFQEKVKKNPIGFTGVVEEKEEPEKIMTNEDLIEYGLMSEFVGRIPVKIPIKPLNDEDLENVLTKSNISCLKIYENALYEEDKVRVVYDDRPKFISTVANKASELGIGVRGLKTVIDEVFMNATAEISKELPNERILVLSSDTVNDSNAYQLKKVRGESNHELPKRNGANSQ